MLRRYRSVQLRRVLLRTCFGIYVRKTVFEMRFLSEVVFAFVAVLFRVVSRGVIFFQNRTQIATGGPFSLKNCHVCALGCSSKVLAKQIKSCVDKNIKNHCLYKLKRVIGNAEHCLPQLVTRFWDDSWEAAFYASVLQSGRLGVLSGTPGSLQGSQTLRFKANS